MIFKCLGDFTHNCWGAKLKWQNSHAPNDDILPKNVRVFSFQTLQVATGNFRRPIGSGGFGSVYKGVLEDNTAIAVKKLLHHRFKEQRDDFFSLIDILSRIRHRNLVQFIGCCVENGNRLIVYEYVENGSLDRFLFGSDRDSALDWEKRAAICIGTARGLVYLHEGISPRVIHHDIKPQNILLDMNFTPKIADFDIARFLDDDISHCSDEIRGTVGYLDPEYLGNRRLTEKMDVYAFGILILEVIGGKRNYGSSFEDDKLSLVDWAWELQENDRFLEMVDPKLDYFPEDEVINFINVALFCVQVPSSLRPSMFKVLLMLSGHYNFSEEVPRKPTHGDIPSFLSHRWSSSEDSASAELTSIREHLERKEISQGKGVQSFRAASADSILSVHEYGKGQGSGVAGDEAIQSHSSKVVEGEGRTTSLGKTEIDLISFEGESQSLHFTMAEDLQMEYDPTAYSERSVQPNTESTAAAGCRPNDESMRPEAVASSSMKSNILSAKKADDRIIFETEGQSRSEVISLQKVNTNQSIESSVQEILGAFQEVQVRTVGVYGKGGIGKTTVLKALFDNPETKNLFNLVIWVTVSRNSSRRKIQDQILQQLSLQVNSNSEDEIARVVLNHLNGKKVLLLLDDVWELINLHEIGIPDPAQENGWRLVLTSRHMDICLRMADRGFEVKALSTVEAWELFRCQAGEVVDFPEIHPYAQLIPELCGGLPLLVLVCGQTLRMESDVLEWKRALKKFILPAAVNNGQYASPQLKFCYDRLKAWDVKSCFLYSALFPEGEMIDVSKVVECFVDEGLLAGTIETALKRGHDIMKRLIDSYLFEVSQDGKMVKMHDVVRDMALEILSLETEICQLLVSSDFGLKQLLKLESEVVESFEKTSLASESAKTFATTEVSSPNYNQYMTRAGAGLKKPPPEVEWEQARMIFLMGNYLSCLPVRPSCPNLTVLFLQRNFNLRVIPASFFDLMPSLRVLNLSKTRVKSLPQSLFKLRSLQVLTLRDCQRLLVLPPEIGDLKSLEVLDLKGTEISKLPDTIVGLVKLKSLQVSFYGSVIRSDYVKMPQNLISKGVISSLVLRELGIFVYPGDRHWMSSAFDVTVEVSGLRLCSLSFHFPDVKQLEYFLSESPSWKLGNLKYNFVVGHDAKRVVSQVSPDVELMYNQQDRCLRFVNGQNIPDAVIEVLKHATSFYIDHHLCICYLSEFGVCNMQLLKFCVVRDCPKLEVMINDNELKSNVFPCLEHLSINCLWNLRRIWVGRLPMGSLSQLRYLAVHSCPQLTSLLTCSMIDMLSNLEELVVEDCPLLKDIVREDEAPSCGNHDISIRENIGPLQNSIFSVTVLHKLKALKLHYLPELTAIWKGLWPPLRYISFYNCPNLKNLHMDSSIEASIEEIRAERAWWDNLEWEDAALCSRLHNHVTQICVGVF